MLNKCLLMKENKVLGIIYYNDNFTDFKFELDKDAEPFVLFYGLHKDRNYKVPSRVIDNFFTTRIFPSDRYDADILLERMGFTYYNKLELLKYTNATAVTNPYWVDWGKGLTWEDVRIKPTVDKDLCGDNKMDLF